MNSMDLLALVRTQDGSVIALDVFLPEIYAFSSSCLSVFVTFTISNQQQRASLVDTLLFNKNKRTNLNFYKLSELNGKVSFS